MISSEIFNNFKYYSKVLIILLVVFLLLRFMLEIRPYEAILLASIIAVSVLIIENIIFINNNASDPLNCNQCKVSVVDNDNASKLPSVSTPAPENGKNAEPFIGNLSNHLNELYSNVVSKVFTDNSDSGLTKALEKTSDDYEYKCVRIPKNNGSNAPQGVPASSHTVTTAPVPTQALAQSAQVPTQVPAHLFDSSQSKSNQENDMYNNGAKPKEHMDSSDYSANSDITEGFEMFMEDQEKKNVELKSIPNATTNSSEQEISNSQPLAQNIMNTNLPSITRPESIPETRPETRPESRPESIPESIPETKPEVVSSEDLSYSVNYVQYQKDGLQQEAANQSGKINQFRRDIANQEAVTPWSEEGYKYYSDIFTRSVGAPSANQALTNELKYGDYNYVGPINKGMINKEYTFVSPTNWYPIPPHPPVCVTNKSCTTCPVQMSNGKDYMNWASWDEFDQARRFTGDMGINIDYVKNVLNNPNGF